MTKHRGAGRQQESVSCCQQPHHLSLEAHCRMASTWALELARHTRKFISLTHWWVNSGWAPHSIWGSVSYWPLCYWGVEMVRLPSYGVIKMCECRHGQFQMAAALLQVHICFVIIIIIVFPRWIFPFTQQWAYLCAGALAKRQTPEGSALPDSYTIPTFTPVKPVPVAVAAPSKPTMKSDPAEGLSWVRLYERLLHNSNDSSVSFTHGWTFCLWVLVVPPEDFHLVSWPGS